MLVTLLLVGLLASALGGLGRIALISAGSVQDDVRAVRAARVVRAQIAGLERAPFGMPAHVLEARLEPAVQALRVRGYEPSVRASANAVVIEDSDGALLAIGALRREAPTGCRFDPTGRRCE